MAYDNTNSIIIYKNDRRRDEKDAEYTGSVNVEGREFWVNLWVKEGKPGSKMQGKKFFSGKLRAKQPRQSADNPPAQTDQRQEEMDVPF